MTDREAIRRRFLFVGFVVLTTVAVCFFLVRPGDESTADPLALSDPTGAADPGGNETESAAKEARERIDLYRDLMALARTDRRAFIARVEKLSVSEIPRERIDALRAWYEVEAGAAVPALARALTDPEATESAHEFAFAALRPRCVGDGRARDALIGYLRLGPEDAKQKSTAFAEVLRWGDIRQMSECLPLVHAERDPDVVLAAVRGMRASAIPETRAKVESLHWRHPSAEVRKRLRTLGIGR